MTHPSMPPHRPFGGARIAAAGLALALVAGCQTTPTEPPALELPAVATAASGTATLASERWWTLFNDPVLDRLEDEALAHNLDIAAAIARVDYARAQVQLAQADLLPSVGLGVDASRGRATRVGSTPIPDGISSVGNDFRVGLQASYELDVWGKFRTATRAAQKDLLASRYARESVRAAVTAATAQAYFTLVASDAQLALLRDTQKSREESLSLQRDRQQGGIIGNFELRSAEAELAAVQADVAFAQNAVAQAESALAALVGRSPRAVFDPQIDRDCERRDFTAVPTLPVGLTSDLMTRRPDIQAAEAQLASANMRIDVARADYFPAISLTGLFGSEAAAVKNLFTGPAAIWGIGASLVQPLFNFKAIEANVTASTARRDELVATYTQTVQFAFRDVHDALYANDATRRALVAQHQRSVALADALGLSNDRYKSGYSGFVEVLDSQRQLLQAQTLEIIAARNARGALVDLAKALGGGWNFPDAVASETTTSVYPTLREMFPAPATP